MGTNAGGFVTLQHIIRLTGVFCAQKLLLIFLVISDFFWIFEDNTPWMSFSKGGVDSFVFENASLGFDDQHEI